MEQTTRPAASLGDDGRYRLLVDAIQDYAICMLDPAGRVSSWNPGAQRITGHAEAEILGQPFSRFYEDDDRASGAPAGALAAAAAAGHFEEEGWRVRKDGARFWAHAVVDPIRGPAGELTGYATVIRDLSGQRAAAEATRARDQDFQLLVQSVTDYALYRLDRFGRVASWNVGAERIKGYRPDEIIGEHFSRFYTEEDRAAGLPQKGLETAAAVGRFEKEGWRIRKDGGRFWAHVVIDAIRNAQGEVIGFAKITRDVTERRQAQKALEEAREALFQSQKMEAIGQLTGGIAHDFNNLLMAVLGSLEMLRRRMEPDPKLSPLVDNAIRGAERGAALTQRMLAFARKQELKLEPVDPTAMMHSMTGLLQRSLGPGVRIVERYTPDLPPALADPNQLEVALLNLAINGRDAMDEDGVLTLSSDLRGGAEVPAGLAPGDYVVLSVADTGEGMDEETLARATEPFFTTKGVGKGTGLGLPMVHGVAAQSGGRLVLKSRKGEGTTAELWLPLATEAAPPAPAEPPPPVSTEAMMILAVDDDDLVLTNTASMLEDMGHAVVRASSGPDALAVVRSGRPIDLMITDQAMPQMTGLQLIQSVHMEHPGLPVILATGYAEMPEGADANLPRLAKPFLQRDLAYAIARAARQAEAT